MLSIIYIWQITSVLIILIETGMSMRIIYIIMKMISAGEGWNAIMKVIGKRLLVVVLAACIQGFVLVIRFYYG